ncbi:MAG: GntR family transcriptional regulator [Acholeplasmataceae bacterium]|jgi:GntR family transcriptional regulator|nr:GntR family transcriptional regulator [Acholeplasmataceae bacterium]
MEFISIDKTIKKAIYIQIADSIKEAIISGRLKDMDRLPTEYELCELFGISDIVVKRAYSLLVEEGLVRRIQGSGTFVTTRETYRFPLRVFKDTSRYNTYNYQSKYKRTILVELLKSSSVIARILNIGDDEPLFLIKYVVYIEKTPVLLQTVYLPKRYFNKISQDLLNVSSLPSLIENLFGYMITHVKSRFFPLSISSHEAILLSMMKNDPAHLVKTTISSDDKDLCYLESIFPGQYTEFEVVL